MSSRLWEGALEDKHLRKEIQRFGKVFRGTKINGLYPHYNTYNAVVVDYTIILLYYIPVGERENINTLYWRQIDKRYLSEYIAQYLVNFVSRNVNTWQSSLFSARRKTNTTLMSGVTIST